MEAAEEYSLNHNKLLVRKDFNCKDITNNFSDRITYSTVKAWLYWLAADAVSQWRSLPVEEWSISKIFEELNPELYRGNSLLLNVLASNPDNRSFIDSLDTQFKKSYHPQFKYFSSGIIQWLLLSTKDAARFLTKYTQSCLKQLEDNLENVQPQLHQKPQKYFYSLLPGGTRTAIDYLNNLCEKLSALSKEYELQYQECLYKSEASRHSYEKLSAQISARWDFDKQQKADSVLNALLLIDKYQLNGELYNAGSQLIKSLESQAQSRLMMLGEVDRHLEALQDWYTQASSVSPLNVAFLKQYLSPQLDAVELLKEIEEWANSTRYEWASLNIEISDLKQEILLRLEPVCRDFYAECFQVKEKLNSRDFSDEIKSATTSISKMSNL